MAEIGFLKTSLCLITYYIAILQALFSYDNRSWLDIFIRKAQFLRPHKPLLTMLSSL